MFQIIFSVLMGTLLSGCMLLQPKLHKEIAPKSSYKLEQVTLVSPSEPGWSVMKHDLHSLILANTPSKKNETTLISANIYKVGTFKTTRLFLQHLANERVLQDDSKRFKILKVENQYVQFKGLLCLKYATLSEDHGSQGIDSKRFKYFSTSGYLCRYPLEYLAFQIEISQRSDQMQIQPDSLKTAEQLFSEVQLVPATVRRLKKIK